MHVLNKRYALNTEVRLTTRVYGICTKFIMYFLDRTFAKMAELNVFAQMKLYI